MKNQEELYQGQSRSQETRRVAQTRSADSWPTRRIDRQRGPAPIDKLPVAGELQNKLGRRKHQDKEQAKKIAAGQRRTPNLAAAITRLGGDNEPLRAAAELLGQCRQGNAGQRGRGPVKNSDPEAADTPRGRGPRRNWKGRRKGSHRGPATANNSAAGDLPQELQNENILRSPRPLANWPGAAGLPSPRPAGPARSAQANRVGLGNRVGPAKPGAALATRGRPGQPGRARPAGSPGQPGQLLFATGPAGSPGQPGQQSPKGSNLEKAADEAGSREDREQEPNPEGRST